MNTKKFIQILAVSATALITACEEELTSFEGETPITVTSQVSETTRAGYESSSYQNLPSKFVMDIYQGGGSYDYSLVEMTRQSNSNTYTAPNGTLLLWKGTDHSGASVKAMTIPNGLSAIDPTNAMTINISTNQTTDANVKASDLLGAKTGDGITINGNAINIEFRHLMSKLYVNYTFADGLTSKSPQVNSITLKNTCVRGGYSYKDMNYVNSPLGYGDIQMYHNSTDKATEAIFYPYTPTSNPQLEVSIRINGVNKTLTCPIQFKDNNKSFEGGKKYIMNIRINGTTIDNTSIIVVKDWIEDEETIGVDFSDKKILWIGTSIPSDVSYFSKSYPALIAEATNCTIINNSRPASFVTWHDYFSWLHTDDIWFDGVKNGVVGRGDAWPSPDKLNEVMIGEAFCLAATKQEIRDKVSRYLTDLAYQKYPINIQSVQIGTQWGRPIYEDKDVNESARQPYLNAISGYQDMLEKYSYEELIIPYVNGERAKCDVVVIDHGYNDAGIISFEAFKFDADDEASINAGLSFLQSMIDNPGAHQNHTINNVYKNWCKNNGYGEDPRISYFNSMDYIIQKCKEEASKVNNNVQIIIGNNFASRTPAYRDLYTYNGLEGTFSTYGMGYMGDCIVKGNEAVAAVQGLDIVNVYQHTGLDETLASHLYFDNVYLGFCPDGVHPGSDPTGTLNKRIADIYIEEFKRIFGK